MYVIVAYDIEQKRVSKVYKICARYLRHTQRSLFEGELTDYQLKQLITELTKVIVLHLDTVKIYRIASPKYLKSQEIGRQEEEPYFFLS